MTTHTQRPSGPARGGFHRAFGLWEFIHAFLNGQAVVDDVSFAPLVNPGAGAPQVDIRSAYLQAMAMERAQRAARERGEREALRRDLPIDSPEILDRIARLNELLLGKVRGVKISYKAFTTYFSVLRGLGWVEESGVTERSAFQEINPAAPPRTFYRLTSSGQASSSVTNPVALFYGAAAPARPAPAPVARPAPAPRPARPARPAAAPPPRQAAPPRPVPPPRREPDPREITALNRMSAARGGALTERQFAAAVELLVSGQVATAQEASDRAVMAIRSVQQRQRAERQRETLAEEAPAPPPASQLTQQITTLWETVGDRIQG